MKHLFFGGIHPKYNKEMSTHVTTFRTIVPKQVVIPMQQHIGAPCQPLVQVGDHVLRGQKIGDGEGMCVPVHASVSGTVVAIEPRPHTSGRDVMAVVIDNDFQDTPVECWKSDLPLDQLDADTVLHSIRKIEDSITTDTELADTIRDITANITNKWVFHFLLQFPCTCLWISADPRKLWKSFPLLPQFYPKNFSRRNRHFPDFSTDFSVYGYDH